MWDIWYRLVLLIGPTIIVVGAITYVGINGPPGRR